MNPRVFFVKSRTDRAIEKVSPHGELSNDTLQEMKEILIKSFNYQIRGEMIPFFSERKGETFCNPNKDNSYNLKYLKNIRASLAQELINNINGYSIKSVSKFDELVIKIEKLIQDVKTDYENAKKYKGKEGGIFLVNDEGEDHNLQRGLKNLLKKVAEIKTKFEKIEAKQVFNIDELVAGAVEIFKAKYSDKEIPITDHSDDYLNSLLNSKTDKMDDVKKEILANSIAGKFIQELNGLKSQGNTLIDMQGLVDKYQKYCQEATSYRDVNNKMSFIINEKIGEFFTALKSIEIYYKVYVSSHPIIPDEKEEKSPGPLFTKK